MKVTEDHPWLTRFVSIELALILVAIILYSVTAPTASTNPIDWNPLRTVGLLVGAFSIIVGAFGLAVGALYGGSRYL